MALLPHPDCIYVVVQVLLRDPTDEHVIPVVEELQRRLPRVNTSQHLQGDGKEYLGDQNDAEAAEDGMVDY